MRVNGLKPIIISLDNYFVERKHTPRDQNGDYDFEALDALDIELFNKHLTELFNGNEVIMPKYNFTSGTRRAGQKPHLNNND